MFLNVLKYFSFIYSHTPYSIAELKYGCGEGSSFFIANFFRRKKVSYISPQVSFLFQNIIVLHPYRWHGWENISRDVEWSGVYVCHVYLCHILLLCVCGVIRRAFCFSPFVRSFVIFSLTKLCAYIKSD